MGNKNSGTVDPSFPSEETGEEHYSRPPLPPLPPLPPHRTSPPFPKRTYSVLEKSKSTDLYGTGTYTSSSSITPQTLTRTTSIPATSSSINRPVSVMLPPLPVTNKTEPSPTTFDDLNDRVIETTPKSGLNDVSLDTVISISFDREVKTVNINKLFEVTCESCDGESCYVKGRVSYESRQMKAEFTPINTLYPNSTITVRLSGKSITTSQCTQSINIKDMSFSFHTSNPAPKSVGIKLKDETKTEQLQIANYYDLYNSLINWSSRKWGCSGEHVIGVYSEKNGKLVPLKADQDILGIRNDDIIVIEIKD